MLSLKILGMGAASAAAFSLCDAMAANWARNGSVSALLLTLTLGPIGYLIFGILNIRTDLAVAGGLVNGLIILLTAATGVLIFKQELRPQQLLGLGLIVAGILLATITEPQSGG